MPALPTYGHRCRAPQIRRLWPGPASTRVAAAATAAQTLASNYVTKGAAPILSQMTLATPTVTPGTQNSSGDVTAYTMTVTVTATVPTTVMALVMGSMTVNATATAKNPIVTGTVDLKNWKISACDANSVYWYPVPAGGGIPPSETLTLMFTNVGGTNPPSVNVPLSASPKIGFAFKNVTGGKCAYGSNQYGGSQGSTHWFYSSQSPPNGGAYASTATKDCSLQVIKGIVSKKKTTYAGPEEPMLHRVGQSHHGLGPGQVGAAAVPSSPVPRINMPGTTWAAAPTTWTTTTASSPRLHRQHPSPPAAPPPPVSC